jgi:uncharacterized protein
MPHGLPALIEPERLAEQGVSLAGRLPLGGLRRLGESLADRSGFVEVALHFRLEGRGRSTVTGRLAATLRLVCQRCLEPYDLAVDVPVHLVVVRTEREAERLGDAEDPLVVDQGSVSLAHLVEDELLLALPQIPAHPEGLCHSETGCTAKTSDEASERRPFAALGTWRRHPGG